MNIGNKRVINSFGIVLSVLISSLFPVFGDAQASQFAEQKLATTPPGVYLPVILHGSPAVGSLGDAPVFPPSGSGWLEYLNYYRATAGLNPVSEDPSWSLGGWLHSRYMVKNDYVAHSEDPQKFFFTVEGDTAAKSSNLVATSNSLASDRDAIELWMQAPFHALGILDPELQAAGYGSYREEDGGLQMGASLDVLRGLKGLAAEVNYPIAWPGDGMVVPLTSHFTEYPDPLSSCPGYQKPAGLPIILQIGSGDTVPNVTAYSLKRGSQPLESCVFDETNYQNPDANARELGRAVLDARDAIVLIPRLPLTPGASYTVSITANGSAYTWSFSVMGAVAQTNMLKAETAESPEVIVK